MFSRLTEILPYLLVIYLSLPLVSAILLIPNMDMTDISGIKNAMMVSISSAFLTTIISGLFGVPIAYRLARVKNRWNQIIEALVISPIVLPPLVTGLFLLSIFSPAGFVGKIVENAGFQITRTFFAVVLAQIAVASPFTIISSKTAFEGIDVKLEFASRLMGVGKIRTFLKISLPLAKKGILAGLLMTFVRAIGEFGATFMLAYFPKTLPIYLYTAYLKGGIESAVPVAIILWVIGLGVFILIRFLGDGVAGTEGSG